MLAQAEQEPGLWAEPGPTRTTSIIACLPAFVDQSGASVSAGSGAGAARASMGASGHIDADNIDLAKLEAESRRQEEYYEIPEGAERFDLETSAIAQVCPGMVGVHAWRVCCTMSGQNAPQRTDQMSFGLTAPS